METRHISYDPTLTWVYIYEFTNNPKRRRSKNPWREDLTSRCLAALLLDGFSNELLIEARYSMECHIRTKYLDLNYE